MKLKFFSEHKEGEFNDENRLIVCLTSKVAVPLPVKRIIA